MLSIREELHAFVDRLADVIEKAQRPDDWVDQARSPLGREKHIDLVKAGKLPGVKEGRKYLVRRSDLDAYLAKHKVVVVDDAKDLDAAAAEFAANVGRRRKK